MSWWKKHAVQNLTPGSNADICESCRETECDKNMLTEKTEYPYNTIMLNLDTETARPYLCKRSPVTNMTVLGSFRRKTKVGELLNSGAVVQSRSGRWYGVRGNFLESLPQDEVTRALAEIVLGFRYSR